MILVNRRRKTTNDCGHTVTTSKGPTIKWQNLIRVLVYKLNAYYDLAKKHGIRCGYKKVDGFSSIARRWESKRTIGSAAERSVFRCFDFLIRL